MTRPSGGGGGAYTVCSDVYQGACALQYCLTTDASRCAYIINGRTFECGNCRDADSLNSCAQRAVDACN